MEVAENKDDLVDHTRFVIGMNQVLMYIFVLAYFSLYTKSRRTKRQIRAVAIGLPLWLILSIVAGLMNFILYGRSHCKDKSYGSAAIISTIALLVITLMTLLGSLLIFFKNSGGDNKARVTHAEERDSLVANPEPRAAPTPPPKPKPEPVEEEYRPEAGDDEEDEDGIE